MTEGRNATEAEESLFSAAEEMSDADFREFVPSYEKYFAEAQANKDREKPYIEGGGIVIPWYDEQRDSAWPHSRSAIIDTTPPDLTEALGLWASRLGRLGLMSSKVTHREQEYKEDSEGHLDQDGVLTIYAFSIIFQAPCKQLVALAKRAIEIDGPLNP